MSEKSKGIQNIIAIATDKTVNNNENDLINNDLTYPQLYSNNLNMNYRRDYKLPPINCGKIQSLYDFSQDIDNIKAKSHRSDKEVDAIHKEISQMKSIFEKKFKKMIQKQNAELRGIDFILSKAKNEKHRRNYKGKLSN